jgi:hypothetical protein
MEEQKRKKDLEK